MSDKRMSSADRKKEIMDIVLEIIFEKGFYNLTIRNIAEKINLSEAAIYRHFKNKKEIIEKLTNLIFKSDCWQEINYNGSPFEELDKIMEGQFKLLENNPRLTTIIFQEEIFREYSDIGKKINYYRQDKEKKLIKIIKKGQKRKVISPKVNPETFALLFMGAIRVSTIKWKNSSFSYSLLDKKNNILKELFKVLKN